MYKHRAVSVFVTFQGSMLQQQNLGYDLDFST